MVRAKYAAHKATKENAVLRQVIRAANVEYQKAQLQKIKESVGKPLPLRQRRLRNYWSWLSEGGPKESLEAIFAAVDRGLQNYEYMALPWPRQWMLKIDPDAYRNPAAFGHSPSPALSLGWPDWMKSATTLEDRCKYLVHLYCSICV